MVKLQTDTHCSKGHPWTTESTYVTPKGWKQCRICATEYSKTYRRKQQRQDWYLNGGKEAMNKARRVKQYGITPEEWDRMNEEQEGRCAISACRAQPRDGHTLHTDHCHKTGVVRRLLCHRCNMAIGLMADDPEKLRALATYVEEFR